MPKQEELYGKTMASQPDQRKDQTGACMFFAAKKEREAAPVD